MTADAWALIAVVAFVVLMMLGGDDE